MSDTDDMEITVVFPDPGLLIPLESLGMKGEPVFTAWEDMTDEDRAIWDAPPPPDVAAALAAAGPVTVEIRFDGYPECPE